jgi:hypothetical protein
MKKRELCIVMSSLLVPSVDALAQQAPKRCPGNLVHAMGEGWGLIAAYNDALVAACEACALFDESCGPVTKERYDNGWFWNHAYLTVQCEVPCPPVTCDDEYDECS